MSKAKVKKLGIRDGWFCHYCKHPLVPEQDRDKHKVETHYENGEIHYFYKVPDGFKWATLDHKVPRSKGGSHELSNLVLACNSCNATKGNRHTYEEFKMLMLKGVVHEN